jgi:hypothetical protein
LTVLDFADDSDLFGVYWVLFSEYFANVFNVRTIPGERNCNKVNFMFKAKIDNVIFVVLVDSWKLDDTTRQAHVFLLSEFSIVEHLNYNNVIFPIDTFDN